MLDEQAGGSWPSDSVLIPGSPVVRENLRDTWLETLHDWVVTVDHKKLGHDVYRLRPAFPGDRRDRSDDHAHPACVPHNTFVSPQVFNRMFTMHGTTMIFFVAMPILFGFAQLPGPADDRRARHGVSPPERLEFLDDRFRRPAALLQLHRRHGSMAAARPTSAGSLTRRLTSPAFSRGHSTDYWTLRCWSRVRQHRHSGQYRRHYPLHALSRA